MVVPPHPDPVVRGEREKKALSPCGRGLGEGWQRYVIAALVGWLLTTPATAQSLDALPGWTQDRQSEVVRLLLAECPRLDVTFRAACAEAPRVPPGDDAAARAFLQWAFVPRRQGQALFTGYFELELPGARQQGGPYQVPVLRVPPDPGRFDRAQIERGALAGRGLELVWLTSPADLYFLQLQGSGRIRLAEGGVLRIGSAALNGRASVPTATLFGDADISNHDLSIPNIRVWIAGHPTAGAARLARDPSYVFMAERGGLRDEEGPVGALGVPMAPLRSVAVDPHYVALGTLVWVATQISATGQPMQRLMLAQDTGEPIHGPAHVDMFFGSGTQAEAVGGRQNAPGTVWVLVPR